MAGDNPTVTPQPTDSSAAVQPTQPQNTSAAAPAPAPTQAPPASPAPTPGRAPATTLPPSTTSGVHGVLANVALGALAGAAVGIKKIASTPGKAYDSYINHTPYGQKVQMGNLELRQKQQEMDIQKQKAKEESETHLDEHQEAVLRANGMSMDNAHKAIENSHLENMYPLIEGEAKTTLMGQIEKQNAEDRDLLSNLVEAGVPIDITHGAGFSNLTEDHAKSVANGDQIMVSNGKTGKDAGVGFISNAALQSTVIPKDVRIATDYQMDDRGNVTPVYTTLKAGENNALDVLVAHDAGMKKFAQVQQMAKDKFANAQTQAATQKDIAEAQAQKSSAALNEAYAKQIGGGAGGTPTTEIAQAVAALPPDVQKNLQNFEPGIQGLLIRGAGGWIDPNTFPQRLTKGGLGITRSTATAMMTQINPNYTDALYGTIKKANDDFITGEEGKSVRSFNQFLVHSATLKNISDNFQRTNSPWMNKPLNEVRSQGMGDPQVSQMMTAIEAARNEWQTFIDNGYKPDTDQSHRAAILTSDKSSPAQVSGVLSTMGDQAIGRMDQLNESYRTATGVDYPNLITPSGRDAANQLGLGGQIGKYKTGGSYNQGRTPNAAQTPQVPTGAQGVYINGALAGYTTDGKTMVKF